MHCPYICKVHAKALFCIFADEEEVWKNSCPSYWQAVTVGSYISDWKHQRQLLAIYILNTSALFIHMRYIENCRSDLTQKQTCIYSTYLIIVTDAADAVSVNFSGWCKFLQILRKKLAFRQILRKKVAFFYRFNAKNWRFSV